MINQTTKLNAAVGFPIKHSLSPSLHEQIYKDNNINAILLTFASKDMQSFTHAIRTLPIYLTAVTMPNKLTVMEYLDEIDEVAKKINAVNTIINKDGKLYGYNTDIIGVARALREVVIRNKNILLIGAGGAARTVACYLNQVGGLPLYLNRTIEDAEILASEFGGKVIQLHELESKNIDIIINATPVGMYPNIEDMPIPENLLDSHQTVMDIVYNPVETKLLMTAKEKGAKIIPGLEMFVGQALEQVRLWSGKEIDDKGYANLIISLNPFKSI